MLKTVRSTVNVDQITGVLPVVNGGTGVTTSTGTGSVVLSAAPTLSGNVGIGTASPNTTLEVNKAVTFTSSTTFGQFVVKAAEGSTGHMLNVGVDSASNFSFIQAVNRGIGANTLVLQRYGGDVTVGSGNIIPSTAAKGINFASNTPAAGMTSQLLNWYEEGAWTPNFTTWTVAPSVILTGRYIRIGRQVTLTMYCAGGTVAGASVIGGIPFTGASNSASPGIAVTDNTNAIAFAGVVEQNGTTINRLGAATLTGQFWKFSLTYFSA